MPGQPRVFLSVAEDSADVHAASLVRTARRCFPNATFSGLTGPRCRAEGVQTVFDLAASAAMLTGVFSIVGKAVNAIHAAQRSWSESRPDVVVLVDSPELHLPMASRARKAGIPVLYYVAPQTWASRAYRNRRIARDVNRLACILPFEQPYFQQHGVRATFVGHPLFEALRREVPDARVVDELRAGPDPLLAILPGSRGHTIDRMLPIQLDVANRMAAAGCRMRVAVSAVDRDRAARIASILTQRAGSGLVPSVVVDDNASLLTAADLVLVASGTATLHVAYYRKPMIVVYDAGWLGRLHPLGRDWFITSRHLSLVNILAGRRVVPEFMPTVDDVAAVARVAADLLTDRAWQRILVSQVDQVVRPLESASASEAVCRLLAELCAVSSSHV